MNELSMNMFITKEQFDREKERRKLAIQEETAERLRFHQQEREQYVMTAALSLS